MPSRVRKQVHFSPTATVFSPVPHGHSLHPPPLTHASSSTASSGSMPRTPPQYVHRLPGPMPHSVSPVLVLSSSPPRVHPHTHAHALSASPQKEKKHTLPRPPPVPSLHPLLHHSSTPAITYDVRDPPSTLSSSHKSLPRSALFEPATSPPVSHLTLYSPYLSWRITVRPTSPGAGYITVSDVLSQVHLSLRTPISGREYEGLLPSDRERRRVAVAYQERYRRVRGKREYEDEKKRGVRRVDFLMGHTKFRGLEAAMTKSGSVTGDLWVLHTAH